MIQITDDKSDRDRRISLFCFTLAFILIVLLGGLGILHFVHPIQLDYSPSLPAPYIEKTHTQIHTKDTLYNITLIEKRVETPFRGVEIEKSQWFKDLIKETVYESKCWKELNCVYSRYQFCIKALNLNGNLKDNIYETTIDIDTKNAFGLIKRSRAYIRIDIDANAIVSCEQYDN